MEKFSMKSPWKWGLTRMGSFLHGYGKIWRNRLMSQSGLRTLMFVGHSYRALKKSFWVTMAIYLLLFVHEWVTKKHLLVKLFRLQLLTSNQPPKCWQKSWTGLIFPHCPRFWRRKVHLIWGSPVASAMLHLLPVLCLTGGRRLFPYRWQDLVPWMQQQPLHAIEKLLIMYSAFALTKLLLSTTNVKKPRSLLRKKTQLNKCHHSKMLLWRISLFPPTSDIHTGTAVMCKDEVSSI